MSGIKSSPSLSGESPILYDRYLSCYSVYQYFCWFVFYYYNYTTIEIFKGAIFTHYARERQPIWYVNWLTDYTLFWGYWTLLETFKFKISH